MLSSPVAGLIAMPKSSSRLRSLLVPASQPPPCVQSSPRWIVPVTLRMVNVRPRSLDRARQTAHGALPAVLVLPLTLTLLLSPARGAPYHATSTRPALPAAIVG